jgi:signal transduction histidine kinase
VGLGLTVARQLALLMNGNLRYVRSGPLSTFELKLPAYPHQSVH